MEFWIGCSTYNKNSDTNIHWKRGRIICNIEIKMEVLDALLIESSEANGDIGYLISMFMNMQYNRR